MLLLENIIFVAVAFNFFGHVLYLWSIIQGQTKPNLVSWVIWTVAPLIGVFFQLQAGAGLSVLPIFVAGFGSSLTILVGVFTGNAFWKIKAFDIYCGGLAVLALVFYIWTHNLGVSILFAILSDALAFMPTYVKAWNFPETEYHSTYSFPFFSNLVGLLIIKDWSFSVYSFGLYFLVANLAMVIILYRKKILNYIKKL